MNMKEYFVMKKSSEQKRSNMFLRNNIDQDEFEKWHCRGRRGQQISVDLV